MSMMAKARSSEILEMAHENEIAMKYSVSLIIRGVDLDPSAVTEQLTTPPTFEQQRGTSKTSKSGKVIIPKVGSWDWCSVDAGTDFSSELRVHVASLTKAFAGVKTTIQKLHGVDSAWIDVYVSSSDWESDQSVGFVLEPEVMADLASFCLPVEFNIDLVSE